MQAGLEPEEPQTVVRGPSHADQTRRATVALVPDVDRTDP